MPWRCLLYVLAGAMAVVVFVLGFDGPSMAQAVDLSTPEKTIDAMGTCGGAGSGSAAARRRIKRHGELGTLVTALGAGMAEERAA